MAAKRKIPEHLEPQVATNYEAGVTIRELGSIYNCSPGTIRNVLIRRGVALRRPGRRASTGAVVAPHVEGLNETQTEPDFQLTEETPHATF